MSTAPARPIPTQPTTEPAWDIAKLFPAQGYWSEQDYLHLSGNRLVEFSHGYVEVLEIPTDFHQAIVAFLFEAILLFTRPKKLGLPRFAPLRLRLAPGKYREPDVMFLLAANDPDRHQEYWTHADLVIEVVSDDDRRRDLETKRFEYARAGIPEYWIVDPRERQITVLKLEADHYDVHGTFTQGQSATSAVLIGFEVSVTDVFAAV